MLAWLAIAAAAQPAPDPLAAMRDALGATRIDCEEEVPPESLEGFSSQAIEARRRERRRSRACDRVEAELRVPAFDVGLGLVARSGPDTGVLPIEGGIEAVRVGPWSMRVGMGVTNFRWFDAISEPRTSDPDRRIFRRFMTTNADLALGYTPVKHVRVEAVGGMSWQLHQQQWRIIDSVAVPFAGIGAALELGPFGIRGRVTTDLRPVDLYGSNGAVTRLSPLRVTASAYYRFGGTKRAPTTDNVFVGTGRRWRESTGGLPGLRASLRAFHRDDHRSTASLELGTEFLRVGAFALETNLTVVGGAPLWRRGPRRAVRSLDLTGDAWFEIGEHLAVGASGGVSQRWFTQGWQDVDEALIPIAGLRTYTPIARSRFWSVGIDTRTMIDLVPIDMILADTAIDRLAPLGIEVGVRFAWGHQPKLWETR
jgi:hypothetical protein